MKDRHEKRCWNGSPSYKSEDYTRIEEILISEESFGLQLLDGKW